MNVIERIHIMQINLEKAIAIVEEERQGIEKDLLDDENATVSIYFYRVRVNAYGEMIDLHEETFDIFEDDTLVMIEQQLIYTANEMLIQRYRTLGDTQQKDGKVSAKLHYELLLSTQDLLLDMINVVDMYMEIFKEKEEE